MNNDIKLPIADKVAALAAGDHLRHVQGCYYIVRLGEDRYLAGYDGRRGFARIAPRDHATTFGSSVCAAHAAFVWGEGVVERVGGEQ